jgi:hypothetical protein
MARSPSGVYTLPAGNPVASGTIIESAWANTTMNDIATALTDSLDREGRGGMNAPLKFADGAASTPGITWINEPSTGWYRAAAGDMRATILGSDLFRLQGGQAQVFAGAQWNNLLYSVPAGNVPSGTTAWQTLTWDNANTVWRATGKFTVDNNTGVATITNGTLNVTGTLPQGKITATQFAGPLVGNADTATLATTANNLARTVSTGTGLTGGGTLNGQSLTLSLDTGSTLNSDHNTISVLGGQGLTGGGLITTNQTLNVAIPSGSTTSGIKINPESIELDYTHLNTVYLGKSATAVQSDTVTNQGGGSAMKVHVGTLPVTRTADTIYFVTA